MSPRRVYRDSFIKRSQWNDFFPLWAEEGGAEEFARRLKDPATRQRIKKDADFLTWSKEHGGSGRVVLGHGYKGAAGTQVTSR